jgi:hypothetical protein
LLIEETSYGATKGFQRERFLEGSDLIIYQGLIDVALKSKESPTGRG